MVFKQRILEVSHILIVLSAAAEQIKGEELEVDWIATKDQMALVWASI
jgi:hypothetical protein